MPVNPIGRLRVLTAGSMSANAMLRVGEATGRWESTAVYLLLRDTHGPLSPYPSVL